MDSVKSLLFILMHFSCLEDAADDVLTSLPSADGSRLQNEADARLAQARARMAPLDPSSALVVRQNKFKAVEVPKPEWHAPWKLFRVISGHNGWVRCGALPFFSDIPTADLSQKKRCVAVDVSNEWFVTGSNDRCIKIWDLASGTLKLTLTGHISRFAFSQS